MTDPVQELLDHFQQSDARSWVTRTGRRSISSAQADPLRRDLLTTRLKLSLPGPPDNLWQATDLMGKIEIDSDADLRLLHSPAGPEVSLGLSMGFEQMLARAMELNLERRLAEMDLGEACERGDLRAFANVIFDQIGVERQWELCHGLEPKFGAEWDEHFCLISALIEGDDLRFELPIAGSATRVEVRIPKGLTLRLGLTARGWASLKRMLGGTKARHIAGAMARIAASSGEMAAGSAVPRPLAEAAFTSGESVLFSTFTRLAPSQAEMSMLAGNLSASLARDAGLPGVNPGGEAPFAQAYVHAIYFGSRLESAAGSVRMARRGHRRAESDSARYGQYVIRAVLQKLFNGGRTVAVRTNGVPLSANETARIGERLAKAMASSAKAD
ncbi:MAG: hypothetical protein C0504_07560 [Candidatus Solibacter sp.]|nr:hypothetical protein [Candidatus Solibacter sp.]